ncbi:MAG: hypothetical protein DRO23_05635 [Thermoprotei archaeon]|nr:MAG: hypothetical protein DRO23_05635 [Thermoprotei archaeon]
MISNFEEMVRKTVEMKRKYHAKALSDSAMFLNLERTFDTHDIFAYYVWILTDLFTNLSIALSEMFGFDPEEFEQLLQTYEIELPSIEELLQGIIIKIVQEPLPDIKTYLDMVLNNIKKKFQEAFKERALAKGIYGESKYGQSYYDPLLVRKFITSSLEKLFYIRMGHVSFKEVIKTFKEEFNVNDNLAKYIFNRIKLHHSTLQNTFILGYGVLGLSKLSPKASEETYTDVLTFDDEIITPKFRLLDHVHYSFILGLSVLGYSYLGAKETVYVEPSPRICKWVNDIAFNTTNRYSATAFATANFAKAEERRYYYRSERADQYQALQIFRYKIEDIVANLLAGEGLTVTQLRQYKNAVNHLLALRAKRHGWGYKAFKAMTDEELKSYWKNYWIRQGLNSSLLEKIYSVIGKWLGSWENLKQNIGKALQEKRKRLAQWI